MDNLPTTRPGETPCARAREPNSLYLTGNARGGNQETLVLRSEPKLNDSRRKAPSPLPEPPAAPPPKPPDDDCISVSTAVSERTDFSCESSSSLFPSVPSADGVGTCPRYRFDDFMTDCLQEDSAFNSIHAGFLLDFSVAFDLGFSDHLLAQDCHGMHRRVFWCWECLSCDVIPPCDGCGESMCKCAIVLNDCHSDCESDCEMHESECEPTWRHMLCEAFFAAPDCKFANKEFCEARCLSYPQVLQNTVGEASAARLHRRLVDRVCQAATDGDMLIVTWAASFAARGAAHAAAKWAIAASKLVSELQQRERRRLRRAMRAGRGAGAVMEELVAEVVAGIAAAVSIEAGGEATAELRRRKAVSAGLVRATKGKRGVGSGRCRRQRRQRQVRAMERQEQEQVRRVCLPATKCLSISVIWPTP